MICEQLPTEDLRKLGDPEKVDGATNVARVTWCMYPEAIGALTGGAPPSSAWKWAFSTRASDTTATKAAAFHTLQ